MSDMTDQQRFLQRRSRQARHFFCRVCLQRPPRHSGGICDPCISATTRHDDPPPSRPASSGSPVSAR